MKKIKKVSLHKINNDKINTKELIHKNEALITYEKIKSFYYGYRLLDTSSTKNYEIYCPNSNDKALNESNIENYPMKSNFYFKNFKNIIHNNYTLLKDVLPLLMEMKEISIRSLLIYQNDMNSFNKRKKNFLFTLVHLGYLGYDSDTENIFIPNKEIQEIFKVFLTPELITYLNESSILMIFNPGEREFKEFTKNSLFRE